MASIAHASPAIEMRSKQDDIDRVAVELEVKERELMSLQAKLQEAEKILVSHFSPLNILMLRSTSATCIHV